MALYVYSFSQQKQKTRINTRWKTYLGMGLLVRGLSGLGSIRIECLDLFGVRHVEHKISLAIYASHMYL